MTQISKDIFKPIEQRNFDSLVSTICGSNNYSKIQAVKKALWLGLFINEEEAEWLHKEFLARGFKDPD